MKENKTPDITEAMHTPEEQEPGLPDEERRKILGKLATGAFVVPLALLVLDGGKSITYAY